MSSHAIPDWDARWEGWTRFFPFDPSRVVEAARQAAFAEATRGADRTRDRHSRMHGEHGHGEHGQHGHGGPAGRGGGRGGGRGSRQNVPFGPGGWPFGRGFPSGPGFGRGARVARGDVREALLALLAEEPMHGYQMIGELATRSGGTWRPSPGSVYPVLSMLADEGLVRAEERDGRRVFHLTEAGQAHVTARAGAAKPWETAAASAADDGTAALRTLAFGVGAAVIQVAQAGDTDQIAAARELLVEARRGLYRILAGDLDHSGATSEAAEGGQDDEAGRTTGTTGATGDDAPAASGPAKDLG
ncbi:PadR family transcriptional regulator [Parafrankia elaeagni]|uniref:PadR family transcriptional regulator n=1 Tax=Parafrankia elaeagni TaxID=222534 RepID=UPI0003696319|nr:PadR family transcriptional regulator [Parafrankia elaeagni]